MQQKVTSLVTGASGFIGTHLVKALEKRGDRVLTMKREEFNTDSPDDLLNQWTALRASDIDYIFHLAAYGNMSNQKEISEIYQANLTNTFFLLQLTRNIPYKALINVSTSSVTLNHQTMYSATKMGAEYLCKAFADEYDKPIVSVRPFSVYGENEAAHRFIPTVFRSCLTGEPMVLSPDAVHDWIYVGDFVKGMLKTAEHADSFKGKSLEFGTGLGIKNRRVVEIIEEITGKKATITKQEQLRSFDNPNWKAFTGYPDAVSLKTGLQKYYDSIK